MYEKEIKEFDATRPYAMADIVMGMWLRGDPAYLSWFRQMGRAYHESDVIKLVESVLFQDDSLPEQENVVFATITKLLKEVNEQGGW